MLVESTDPCVTQTGHGNPYYMPSGPSPDPHISWKVKECDSCVCLRSNPFQGLIALMLRRSKRKYLGQNPTTDPSKVNPNRNPTSATEPLRNHSLVGPWTYYLRAAESQQRKEDNVCTSPFLASASGPQKETYAKIKSEAANLTC